VQSDLHLIWIYKFQNNKIHSWAEIGSNLLHELKRPVALRKRERKNHGCLLYTFCAVAQLMKRARETCAAVCMCPSEYIEITVRAGVIILI
jgi:hypothetical protein